MMNNISKYLKYEYLNTEKNTEYCLTVAQNKSSSTTWAYCSAILNILREHLWDTVIVSKYQVISNSTSLNNY